MELAFFGGVTPDFLFLSFMVNKLTLKEPLPDYSWWIALIKDIARRADRFEIRCWADEPESIAAGQMFSTQLENTETTEVVFQGSITEAFLEHMYDIIDDCLININVLL
jgi:hypothetical protein